MQESSVKWAPNLMFPCLTSKDISQFELLVMIQAYLTHCGLVVPYNILGLVSIGLGIGLLSDDAKPLSQVN